MAVLEVALTTKGFATFIAMNRRSDQLIGHHTAEDVKAWQYTPLTVARSLGLMPGTRSSGPK